MPSPPHTAASRRSPVAPDWVMMADMGMVLMMVVVPGLVVLGETLLIPKMVGLAPPAPACVVVRMVVGFPSPDVTSFRMVPAGSGPFVCNGVGVGGRQSARGSWGGSGTRFGVGGGTDTNAHLDDLGDGAGGRLSGHRRGLHRFGLHHRHHLAQVRDLGRGGGGESGGE